jgi:predicted dehydrogenase
MALEGKVTVYDKGFDPKAGEYIARSGDMWSPQISRVEPLALECREFLSCILEGREPVSGGESGLRVVRVLEGLQRELDESRRAGLARVR